MISIILGNSHTPGKLRKWFSLSEVIFSVRSCVAKKSEEAHILLSLGKNNIDFRGFCYGGQGGFLTAAQRKLHLDWEARHFLACVSPLNGIQCAPLHLSNPPTARSPTSSLDHMGKLAPWLLFYGLQVHAAVQSLLNVLVITAMCSSLFQSCNFF